MRTSRIRHFVSATLALCTAAQGAYAQDAQSKGSAAGDQPGTQSGSLQEVVVTGVRASLDSAQAIKRDADQIVDSVQAQDIGKLPDVNTVEALQRITGVQIQRRYGEGDTDFDHRTQSAITVRGLTQVSNFIDGRAAIRQPEVARSISRPFRPSCSPA